MIDLWKQFLKLEAAGGVLIVGAAFFAMLAANLPVGVYYDALLNTPVSVRVGALEIAKPLLLWVNDGLMAVFFLLVGLELKREMFGGQLSSVEQVALPGIAAVGGMLVPAGIYAWINWGDPVGLSGWAIPAATDIAFALGVLALLGPRVPAALKLFLLALAIIDDLGAIVIIALFYTADLSVASLIVAGLSLVGLAVLNFAGVRRLTPYVLIGIVLWISVLKSGVHATLAGVAMAFFIPYREDRDGYSPLQHVEHELHPWVAYMILPVFAFANAGVSLHGLSLDALIAPVPLGIALGLFVGKQLGVFGFTWAAVRLGLARLPASVSWVQVYGVSVLCGIGFTMSLFIGSLAFDQGGPDYAVDDRLGILMGSLASALLGYLVLWWSGRRAAAGRA